jgi:hypothetical protein
VVRDVSVGDGSWTLRELQTCHVNIAWQVTDDGSCVDALINLHWFNWFLWNSALADAATLGVDHSWDVVFAAGLFTGDG